MKRKMSPGDARALWLSRIVLWIVIAAVLFPVIWIVMSSFSAGDSFFLSSLFPEKVSLEHYITLFRETDFVRWAGNSVTNVGPVRRSTMVAGTRCLLALLLPQVLLGGAAGLIPELGRRKFAASAGRSSSQPSGLSYSP